MASRSLGVLTYSLIAEIGGFTGGLDKAGRAADKKAREIAAAQKRMVQDVERSMSSVGNLIGGALGSISLGAAFTKFMQETKAAEQEMAQLAAVLRSTGEAAGWSQSQLNDMAAALGRSSTFSEGEISKAQTRLLSYTGVVGKQFPEAMQAALDMAARMGTGVEQAAETIGKALDVPSQGLSALSKQGFRFTEDQKRLAEHLEKTGRTGEAQGIILQALGSSYGGAARAARDTFGGALTALQNNINTLLTGDSGSMAQMTKSVEDLNTTLSSSETRAAFQTFTGWMASVSTAAIQGAANLITFANTQNKLKVLFGTDEYGKMQAAARDASAHLSRLTDMAERYQIAIGRGQNVEQNTRNLNKIRERIAVVSKEAGAASQALKEFADKTKPLALPSASTATAPPTSTVVPPPKGGKPGTNPFKTQLDDDLKTLERFITDQRDLMAERNRMLELYNGQGLLSMKDYFAGQQNILDEATQEQSRAYDAQIKALQNYISTAKGTDRTAAEQRMEGGGQVGPLFVRHEAISQDVLHLGVDH